MRPANRFFGIILFFHLVSSNKALDPGEFKPCFERYNGYRLVGVQPYHSEWRISVEENCLEFCVKTASRCASIVFDKNKHLCHYFSSKGLKDNGIVRYPKFVYLQPTSANCLEKFEIILAEHSTVKEQKMVENVQNEKDSTVQSELIPTMNREKEKDQQSMKAILDRIDAELREQIEYNSSSIVGQNSKAESIKEKDSSFSTPGQSFLKENNKFGMRMQKLAMVKKEAPEIRRHPKRNGNNEFTNGNIVLGDDDKGRRDNLDKGVEEREIMPPMTYDCDAGSNLIWMAVENSSFNKTNLEDAELTKNGNSAKECIGMCESIKIDNHRHCNAFSFDERQSLCHFTKSGKNFPKSLISSPGSDFSKRAFTRFCYPGTFSAFSGCSEFIAFIDYKLELEPRETFDGLPPDGEGISACIELCVLSNGFKCMSGLFDQSKGVCHLYNVHSLAKPAAFQRHVNPGQLYFENGCADSIRNPQE